MPRFVVKGADASDSGWIGSHEKDIEQPGGPKDSKSAHDYVQREASRLNRTYEEVADERGGVCTLFPNTITPEGRPGKVESRV